MTIRTLITAGRMGRRAWLWFFLLLGLSAGAQMTSPVRMPGPQPAAQPQTRQSAAPASSESGVSAEGRAASGAESGAESGGVPGGAAGLSRMADRLRQLSQACQASEAAAENPSAFGPGEGARRLTVAEAGIELLQALASHGAAPELSAATQDEFVRQLLALTGSIAILEETLPAVNGTGGESAGGSCETSMTGPGSACLLAKVRRVDAGCVEALRKATAESQPGGRRGMVISLLGSSGEDASAVSALASAVQATSLPVVVLVDQMTRGGAEVLAGELRRHGALLIGEKTHGLPGPTQIVTLKTGQRLLVPAAGAPAPAGTAGLQPDRVLVKGGNFGRHDIPPAWMEQAFDFLAAVNALE